MKNKLGKCIVFNSENRTEVMCSHYAIENGRLLLFNDIGVIAVFNKWESFIAEEAIHKAEKVVGNNLEKAWVQPVDIKDLSQKVSAKIAKDIKCRMPMGGVIKNTRAIV